MIDKLFFVVLILNATGLFRFVAAQVGVSIGQVSLVLLVLNIFYLVAKIKYSMLLFLRVGMGVWLFVLLLWPLLTLLYAPSFEIREIGLLLYYFTLFFGSAVYTVSNGLPTMHRVMFISLFVTLIGMPLSMMAPQYFEVVGMLANARTVEHGRAIGFFMQPNRLAVAFGFLFIGWFALWRRKNTLLEIPVILGFLFAMLLTGSRTGMLIAVIMVTFILTYSWRKRFTNRRYLLKMSILVACLAGGIIVTRYYLSRRSDSDARREYDLVDRMETLLSFKLSHGNIKKDTSIRERMDTQVAYLSLVKDKPLLGHGFGSDTYYQENGMIFLSAHSTALTCAMEYGVLYPFVFGLLCLSIYAKRSRRAVEKVFGTNSVVQFIVILLFLFIVTGGTLDNRVFYVVFGMFFAAAYYPRRVFSYDETTGRICAYLPRRDISSRFAQRKVLRKKLEPLASPEHGIAQKDNAVRG